MKRCNWKNLETDKTYQEYHDNEWSSASYDDRYLFEMLVLESFHCGLSWLIILKKRESFKKSFDNFDVNLVANYSDDKIEKLLNNPNIVRNKLKIEATINNAKCFIKIQKEFGSFSNYIWSFTNNKIIKIPFDLGNTRNELSDKVSKDMKRRGIKFMGTITTYAYLESIGILDNHSKECFKYKPYN